jgi:hypothetical protein
MKFIFSRKKMSAKIRRYNFIKVLGEGQVERKQINRKSYNIILLISMLLYIKQKIHEQMMM